MAKAKSKTTEKDPLEGKKAPAFRGPLTSGQQLQSKDLEGQWTVLYFYPRNNTSGCTRQGQDFRDQYKKFRRLGAQVIGVSTDKLSSHEKFKEKQDFPFELLSDEEKKVSEAFKVWKEKSMYGRKYFGIERSTFLISPERKVVKAWRKVKVPGHVAEVLEHLKELQ